MGEEGTSYTLKIDDEIGGLDDALGKLKETEKVFPKVDESVKGLGDSLKGAGKAGTEAEQKIDALNKRLKELKAPGEIKRLTKEVEEFGKKEGVFQHFTHAALEPFLARAKQVAEFEFLRRGVDALIEAPGEIIEKLSELGQEMVLTAAKAERLDQSFKLTLGQEGAEEVLGWIEKISSKTEFTDDQLKGWSSELLRAGVKMSDVDAFLSAGLDTAAKSTDKMAGMSAAISALSRAQLTGRVESRSLRGLSIGVDELKTLPQFKGLDDKQLHQKMEQGSISKNDLLTLIAGKDGVLGDLGLVAGKTFEAQLKNVKEIPEQIYQGLYKTAGFQKLGDFLSNIYETFGPESETGKRAAEALAGALDYVATSLETIDLDVVASEVGDALDSLPVAIETAKDVFDIAARGVGFFADAISGVIKILHDFTPAGFIYDHFIKKSKAEEDADFSKGRDPATVRYEQEQKEKLSAAREARAQGKTYVDPDAALHPDETPLERARRRKGQIREEMRESAKAGGDGMKGGADDSHAKVKESGAGMGDALKEGANESLENRSPSRALFRAGAFAGEGFVDGIESQRADIDEAMATAFTLPAVSGQAAAGAGSPSITIDIGGISVSAPAGSDGHEMAAAIAAALHQMLPGALVGALDGVRAEAGS